MGIVLALLLNAVPAPIALETTAFGDMVRFCMGQEATMVCVRMDRETAEALEADGRGRIV